MVSVSFDFSSTECAASCVLTMRFGTKRAHLKHTIWLVLSPEKEEFFALNTSGDATCDESFEETIHAMKKAIILGSVLSVFALMLVSCSSEPTATTTTTRQTTVTTPAPPPTSQTTTTTTHQMGGGY